MVDRRHRLTGVSVTGRLVVGALLLALVGAAVWLWQRDDDGGSSSKESGPQEVLEDYYALLELNDCDFTTLATTTYAETLGADACREDPKVYFQGRTVEGGEFQIGEVDITKDTATASVRYIADGQELATGIATLVMSDGEWKVDAEDDDPT